MTARRWSGGKLVIASHNQGKVEEIAALLAPFGADVISAGALGLPEPEETGDSFIANALLKAHAAATAAGCPSLADDSGMAVTALDGAPGIYSARWAGPQRDFRMAMTEVENKLRGHADRSGQFICALALAWPDGHAETVQGVIDGQLVWPPRGENGFGYDPVFLPAGHAMTFGQMSPSEKHLISHRADAFRQLVARCFAAE
jgi:XTP/dITP diphosphohydrolase